MVGRRNSMCATLSSASDDGGPGQGIPSSVHLSTTNSMIHAPCHTCTCHTRLCKTSNRKSTAYFEPSTQSAPEILGDQQTRKDGHQRSRYRVQGVERDLPSGERLATRVGRCCPP
jgi:hypothetical protein